MNLIHISKFHKKSKKKSKMNISKTDCDLSYPHKSREEDFQVNLKGWDCSN